jgi:drug/metabolite transporter (DMT)-like permease
VITYNKFLLSVAGFPYPITLTLWHMLFCSTIAFALVRSGWVKSIDMEFDTYVSAIVPIGACYAVSLWVGNAAYLHLSVSFIQMLKALMPVAVFLVGSLMGVEKFELARLANMSLIAVGVAIASFGEINFNVFGVALQMGSIVAESIRLTLVQCVETQISCLA